MVLHAHLVLINDAFQAYVVLKKLLQVDFSVFFSHRANLNRLPY